MQCYVQYITEYIIDICYTLSVKHSSEILQSSTECAYVPHKGFPSRDFCLFVSFCFLQFNTEEKIETTYFLSKI